VILVPLNNRMFAMESLHELKDYSAISLTKLARARRKSDEHLPMLEFIARKYPPAWLLLSFLA